MAYGVLRRLLHRCGSFPASPASRLLALVAALGLLVVSAGSARATLIAGESAAFGVLVDLEVPFLPDLSVPETPAVAGSAPTPFALSDALLAVNGSVVDLGLLVVEAASDVDGASGIRFAGARAELESMAVEIPSLFSLELSTLSAEARSEGNAGALASVGEAVLGSLSLEVRGEVVFDGAIAPDPNTTVLPGLLGPLGVELVLNEQTLRGDGVTETGIAVSALHVQIARPFLRGEIVVSHAESQLLAVPAPGAGLLVVAGLGAAAALARRRGRGREGPDAPSVG